MSNISKSHAQHIPVNCHLHVNVIPLTSIINEEAKDLPEVNKQVEKWLDMNWEEKEKQMEYFVKHQKFDEKWTANQV